MGYTYFFSDKLSEERGEGSSVFVFSYSRAAASISSQHCRGIICQGKRFHVRKNPFVKQGMFAFPLLVDHFNMVLLLCVLWVFEPISFTEGKCMRLVYSIMSLL